MEKISSLIPKLNDNVLRSREEPLTFLEGEIFSWNPSTATITYRESSAPEDIANFLHEVGHAERDHTLFVSGVELLTMEQEAWTKGAEIAAAMGIKLPAYVAEEALDSYRDWLHSRSLCPQCNSTGVETSLNHFSCLACHTRWKANEARLCALRRYKT
jgi:hypothetical protein